MKPKLKKQERRSLVASNQTEFASSVIKIAVSQVCKSVGFKSVQLYTLDILTDVAIRYLHSIAKSAAAYANASGRTQSNVFDLVSALCDINSVSGFQGAASLHKNSGSLLASGVLYDLNNFVKYWHEIPFAKPVPKAGVVDSPLPMMHSSGGTNFLSVSQGLHIPRWLPPFPDMATFVENRETSFSQRNHGEQLWGSTSSLENHKSNELTLVNKGPSLRGLEERRGKVKFTVGMGRRVGNGMEGGLRKAICGSERRVYCRIRSDDDETARTDDGDGIKRRKTHKL
ncbi:BTP domain-containing protein [Psidium guajava]|nr:BTP domain-containing protein [Psidium guajava]